MGWKPFFQRARFKVFLWTLQASLTLPPSPSTDIHFGQFCRKADVPTLLQHHFLSHLHWPVSSHFPVFLPTAEWWHLYLHFPIMYHVYSRTAFSCATCFLWGVSDHFPDSVANSTISEIPETNPFTVCTLVNVSPVFSGLTGLTGLNSAQGAGSSPLLCTSYVFIGKWRYSFASKRSFTLTTTPRTCQINFSTRWHVPFR